MAQIRTMDFSGKFFTILGHLWCGSLKSLTHNFCFPYAEKFGNEAQVMHWLLLLANL